MIYFAKWKVVLILLICLGGVLYAAPNLLSRTTAESLPGFLPNKQINLGLDLRGGLHLLLEADVQKVVGQRLDSLVDEVRATLRRVGDRRIGYTGLGTVGNRAVGFTLRNPNDVDDVRDAIRANLDNDYVLTTDGARFRIEMTEQAVRDRTTAIISQSIEIVRRRVDPTGTKEPTIQRQGADRILLQIPGEDNPERIKNLLDVEANMEFRMVDVSVSPIDIQSGNVPAGSEILQADPNTHSPGDAPSYAVQKRVLISGDMLVDAQPSFQDGQPVVSFRFNAAGARRFAQATTQNVGRPFAIVLDDKVISAPVIREPILGGSGIISGRFTVEEVNELALLIRAGALPTKLTILEERTVGPDLGADSIRAGEIASVLAIVLVVIFMAAAYGLFGLMADIALVINLVLILALLSLLQATLTLPGIAGIALTVGMAVDANVLIFERIREEQRAGRTPISAIDAGFSRALTTIIDSNLTTLIAAILLFQFGSGPVRGFAVTLSIGLLTSMFSAIWVTRLMIVTWLRRRRPQALPI